MRSLSLVQHQDMPASGSRTTETVEQSAQPRPASEKESGCAPSWVPSAPASGPALCVQRRNVSGFHFVDSVQVIGC